MKRENINVYLNSEETNKKVSDMKIDSKEEYLITDNIQLREQIINLNKENIDLKHLNEIAEDEADKNDERLRYIRNELKNFAEKDIMLKKLLELSKKEKSSQLKIQEVNNDYDKKLKQFILLVRIISSSGIFALWYFNKLNIVTILINELSSHLNCFYFFGLFDTQNKENLLNNYYLNIKSVNEQIKKIQTEIKEIEYSNDFITKYIDGL